MTPAGCAWTATSNAPSWLAITSSVSGSGGATVTYSAAANPGSSPRAGSLTIGGRSFSVTQAAGCTYSLTPSSTSIGYAGGDSLTFGVVTSAGNCAWSVLTPVNWLKALPDGGSGNGTITYSVYPNYSGLTRSAALVAGGKASRLYKRARRVPRDERFVQLLYFNFYGRRPSPSEISFQVINGVGPQGRAQVALNFFNGTDFLNGGRYIAGLYFGLLGRAPDYNGWLFQRNAMARNIVDPIGLITNFLNGAEFQQKYGPLSDTAFVTLLYNQILLRPPDPEGLTAQVNGIRLYGRAQIGTTC